LYFAFTTIIINTTTSTTTSTIIIAHVIILKQTEEKVAIDTRRIAQLQKEEQRLKEELESTKLQMKLIASKAQALERRVLSTDGSSKSTEHQLQEALQSGKPQRCFFRFQILIFMIFVIIIIF
jgi:hypothetical protein